MSERKILLILRHSGIGDFVMARPALNALRYSFPDHEIVNTCPSWLMPLVERYSSADRLICEVPTGAPRKPDPSLKRASNQAILDNVLREVPQADIVVVLRRPNPEVGPVLDVLAPRAVACFQNETIPVMRSFPEEALSVHILERWRLLLAQIGVSTIDDDISLSIDVPPELRELTVVHQGAGAANREWAPEKWAEVARYLENRGHRVVLTGSEHETKRADAIRQNAGLPPGRVWTSNIDILHLTRIVAGARLVVAGDTGVSHLATAFRRPAVSLFGPTAPAMWGPPSGNPQHIALYAGPGGNIAPPTEGPPLGAIQPEHVIGAVERLGF